MPAPAIVIPPSIPSSLHDCLDGVREVDGDAALAVGGHHHSHRLPLPSSPFISFSLTPCIYQSRHTLGLYITLVYSLSA